MKQSFQYGLLLFATYWILIIVGCKHKPIQPDYTNAPLVESDNCSSDTVYFQNQILPLFVSNCALSGCHDANSASEGIILNSYANIMNTGEIRAGNARNSKAVEVLTETGDDLMPPGNPLSAEQIQLITDWVNQGALNNYCNEACDTSGEKTFSDFVSPLVQTNCQGCHSGSNPQGDISLTNYSEIRVIAADGRLSGVLNGSGYAQMPPGTSLSTCQIQSVQKWISAGYLDN